MKPKLPGFVRCIAMLLATVCSLAASPALAQDVWPARPIRVIVTFPPGGSTDVAMRIVAPRLAERLGQPVLVDNRAGAGGGVGLTAVARSAPDGYTLVLASAGGLTANASLSTNPGYDGLKDFAPVTLFGTSPFVLVARASLPAKDVREVLALARAQPGRLTFASGGNGTAMHLAGELLKATAKSYIVHIPYRGSGPALVAVAGGETDLAIVDIATVRPLASSGRIKLLAVLDAKRSPLAPNLPTMAESGLAGYEAAGWFAVLAPAGTPPAIVARLNAEITAVLRTPDVGERFAEAGLEPLPSTPEALAQRMRIDTGKWAQVIKTSGARNE